MSFSIRVGNKKKYILVLVEGPTQGLNGTTLTEESCTVSKKLIMELTVIYLLMVQKLLN